MQRILNWFFNGRSEMPGYYAEQGYNLENLRLYSADAPSKSCKVDIRNNGVSVLSNYAELSGRETLEELAGNFKSPSIDEGSVITCHIIEAGGVGSLSIQLEMDSLN